MTLFVGLRASCSFTFYSMIRTVLSYSYFNDVQTVIKFKFVHVIDFKKNLFRYTPVFAFLLTTVKIERVI